MIGNPLFWEVPIMTTILVITSAGQYDAITCQSRLLPMERAAAEVVRSLHRRVHEGTCEPRDREGLLAAIAAELDLLEVV